MVCSFKTPSIIFEILPLCCNPKVLSILATLANVSCDKSTQNGLCQTEVRRSEGKVVQAIEWEVPAEI